MEFVVQIEEVEKSRRVKAPPSGEGKPVNGATGEQRFGLSVGSIPTLSSDGKLKAASDVLSPCGACHEAPGAPHILIHLTNNK